MRNIIGTARWSGVVGLFKVTQNGLCALNDPYYSPIINCSTLHTGISRYINAKSRTSAQIPLSLRSCPRSGTTYTAADPNMAADPHTPEAAKSAPANLPVGQEWIF
jgi:hypothetical protein